MSKRITTQIFLLPLVWFLSNLTHPPILFCQENLMSFETIKIPNATSSPVDAMVGPEGFLWLGMIDGLCRFDGKDFKMFIASPKDNNSITHGRVTVMATDSIDGIWLGTNSGGASRLDLKNYRFETIRHSSQNENTIGGNNIGGIFVESPETIWLGSDLFCLNKINRSSNTVTRYYPKVQHSGLRASTYLGKIVADPLHDSLLWIAASYGAMSFNKYTETFKTYYFTAYNNLYKPHPIPIYADRNGLIWVASINGVVRINPLTDDVHHIPLGKSIYKPPAIWRASEILRYSDSTILIQSNSDGLILLNMHTLQTKLINNDPLLGNGTGFCFFDKEKKLWIKHGVNLLHSKKASIPVHYVNWNHMPGMSWSRSFLRPNKKNELYVGTLYGAGLIHHSFESNKSTYYNYPLAQELDYAVLMSDLIKGQDSTILIASTSGLLQFSMADHSYGKIEPPDSGTNWSTIGGLCQCDSLIWFYSLEEGLFAIHSKSTLLVASALTNSKLNISKIRCEKNGLWLGTTSGFGFFNTKNSEFINLVADIHVSDLINEANRVMIATLGEGIFIWDKEIESSSHMTSDVGGATNFIYALATGHPNSYWVNTDGGTLHLDMSEKRFTNYRELGVGKRAPIIQMNDSTVVLGARKSLMYFNPAKRSKRGFPPKLYISSINIANREEDFPKGLDHVNHITLKPNEKELFIEIGAINKNPISLTNLYYRLLEQDTSWSLIRSNKQILLNNLPTGVFELQMKAVNMYSGQSEKIKKIGITVLPPWWSRRHVQLLALIILVGTIYFIYVQLRRRRLNKLYESTVLYFANSRYAENSVDEILWDLARNVISRLQFEDCVVYLVEKESGQLIQKAAYGVKNPKGREILHPVKLLIGKGIVGASAKAQEPVIVSDVTKDDRYIMDIETNGSELSVPIIHQGLLLGVIDSEHSQKKFFKLAHAEVLQRIANECAHKIAAALSTEEIAEKEKDLLEIQKEIAESKLTALQAQMNPHFIFNSLNSINWYILKNKTAEASIYLTKFSKLVRLILDNSRKLSITLHAEINTLRLYLDLEAMRFDHSFNYEIQTDDSIDLEEAMVPPLILQPFVENAIWHGLMHKKGKGNLLIQVFLENEVLKCIVQDDGIGRHASRRLKKDPIKQHKSKGLKLTTDRISLLHKDSNSHEMVRIIDLVDNQEQPLGTRVEVRLPFEG